MRSPSTPKRAFESDGDDSVSERNASGLKRNRLNVDAAVGSWSRTSSRSPASRASSVRILNDAAQKIETSLSEEIRDVQLNNNLPPLPRSLNSVVGPFPQLPPQNVGVLSGDSQIQMRDPEDGDELCFGMLRDVRIQINRVQNFEHLVFDEMRRESDIFACLNLMLGQDRGDIQCQNNITVARMNIKTHRALMTISAPDRIRYKGLLPRAELFRGLAAAQVPNDGISQTTCSMAILVFGPRSVADVLAKELSRHRLFLQHPNPMPSHAAYENPQYLSIVGSSFTNGAVLPPISMEVTRDVPETQQCSREFGEDIVDVIHMMDNLPRHDYLKEADVDERVKTTLMGHQREAVDFIIRRETTDDANPRSLWRLESLRPGASVYCHTITGTKSPVPTNMLGGILADDMGLGKTLTMIATMVKTISHGERFAAGKFRDSGEGKSSLIPVKSTLVLVPSALLLDGWIDEIAKCVSEASLKFSLYSLPLRHVAPGTLQYYKYHGPNRMLSRTSQLPYHVVFSTYGTLASEFRRGGVLSEFRWYRLILDEAHIIRNWSTSQFKAVTSLSATIRWCITGTPVQNSLNDLGSLIKFLRVPTLDDSAVFRKHIGGNLTRGPFMRKPNFENLKLLLGLICLRRRFDSLSLVHASFVEHTPSFSELEWRDYEKLTNSCTQSIDAAVSNRGVGRNGDVFNALLRLRIFCNTGKHGLTESATELPINEHNVRPIEQLDDHTNSRDSIEYPSKLKALLVDIQEHQQNDKSIVFSLWRKSLDLVGRMLSENNIDFRRVDGDISPSHRKKALVEFHDNPSTRVLIMTLGTGAVGLNSLSVASRVHILEPQWNPSVEVQAIGRVLRLGQKKKVCIIRYKMKSSIEEDVKSRQIMKVELALKGGLQSSDPGVIESRRSIQDLQELRKLVQGTGSSTSPKEAPPSQSDEEMTYE